MVNRYTWMRTHTKAIRENYISFSEILNSKNLFPSYCLAKKGKSVRYIGQPDCFFQFVKLHCDSFLNVTFSSLAFEMVSAAHMSVGGDPG